MARIAALSGGGSSPDSFAFIELFGLNPMARIQPKPYCARSDIELNGTIDPGIKCSLKF
jgi:hypothetical protein